MTRHEIQKAAEVLQDILIARATGQPASDQDYRRVRMELIAEPSVRALLPDFVRTARDLEQFWAYVKPAYARYAERRDHIWSAFRPLFGFIETPEGTAPPAQDASSSLASVIEGVPASEPNVTCAFISYSTKDKLSAVAVRDLMQSYGIECFLAHDDLQVSEEWKERILEELLRCQIFVPLLSKSFRESDWAPQEIGVISGRPGVAIVPLSLDGTVPFGFISNIQGRRIPQEGPTADLILMPLLKRWPRLILSGMIKQVREAGSYRGAEAAMSPLVPYFGELTDPELLALIDVSIENDQVWSAEQCRVEFLPKLIALHRGRIPQPKLTVLEYQLENNRRYYGEV